VVSLRDKMNIIRRATTPLLLINLKSDGLRTKHAVASWTWESSQHMLQDRSKSRTWEKLLSVTTPSLFILSSSEGRPWQFWEPSKNYAISAPLSFDFKEQHWVLGHINSTWTYAGGWLNHVSTQSAFFHVRLAGEKLFFFAPLLIKE